ncbi:MAG: hypothetical protein U1A77_16265 [Pirellulales bacterium]
MHFHAEWAFFLLTVPGARNEHERAARFRIELEKKLAGFRKPINNWLFRTSGGRIEFDDLLPKVVDGCLQRFGVVANSFYAFPPQFARDQFRSARTALLRQWEREKADEAVSGGESADVEYDYEGVIDLCEAVGWTREEFSVIAHWLYTYSPAAELDVEMELQIRAKYVEAAGGASKSGPRSSEQMMLDKYLQGARQQEIANEFGVRVSTVNKRLHDAANTIATKLHDPTLASPIHSFSESWSKRARKTMAVLEQEVREPIDHARSDRWREFHQRLVQDLAKSPVLQRVAKWAPYWTIQKLEAYVTRVDPTTDLEAVLDGIHEVAMKQFMPPPSDSEEALPAANPVATYQTSAQR